MQMTNIKIQQGKKFWGSAWWRTIHTIAVMYEPSQKKDVINYINSTANLIPCDFCRDHFKTNLKKYPIHNYLKNNHDLFLWSYTMHDLVNQNHNKHNPRYKKYSPKYDIVKKAYFDALGQDYNK